MTTSKYFSILLTAATLFAGLAQAGNLTLSVRSSEYLPDCGGKVDVNNGGNGNQFNLVFSGVKNCSNFDILSANGDQVVYPNQKLQGKEGNRSASFTLPKAVMDYGYNKVRVILRSNSGKTFDTMKLNFVVTTTPAPYVPPYAPAPTYGNGGGWTYTDVTLTIGSAPVALLSCGGYVQVTSSANGSGTGDQVNLVFKGVRNCSNFDIQSSNYQNSYYTKKMPGSDSSFTLPKRFSSADGWNDVRVVVQSNSGKHADSIRVVFVNVPTGNGGGTKLPSTPNNSGSGWGH